MKLVSRKSVALHAVYTIHYSYCFAVKPDDFMLLDKQMSA